MSETGTAQQQQQLMVAATSTADTADLNWAIETCDACWRTGCCYEHSAWLTISELKRRYTDPYEAWQMMMGTVMRDDSQRSDEKYYSPFSAGKKEKAYPNRSSILLRPGNKQQLPVMAVNPKSPPCTAMEYRRALEMIALLRQERC